MLRLLREVDVLEHDELFAEMATLPTFQRLDVERGIKFDDVVRQFETNLIRQALFVTNGNQARAARLLGIKANTLNYKIKVLKI
jgi:DNA-binding NtrC family response regulator